jgi:hypothetical protein
VPTTVQRTAAALVIWAEARERAIAELNKKVTVLEASGQTSEAKRLQAAAALLHRKLLDERCRASKLRNAVHQNQAFQLRPRRPVDRQVA